MITCSRVPPWETTTKLPAGLTGRIIARHFKIEVPELKPEHIGEGLQHTKSSFMRYKQPSITTPINDDEINNRLTDLYRKYPDLAVCDAVDGLGHLGIQNDSGLYLLIRILKDMLLEPKEELVKSSDSEVASSVKANFANKCRNFMAELNEVLGLNLKLVSELG